MSIKEIWGAASSRERNLLLAAVTKDGTPYPTAYSWCTGTRRPRPLYQESVRKCVKDIFRISVTVDELFPVREG